MAEMDNDKFLSDRGFERVVEAGKPVHYITPAPMARILYKRDHVESYIVREKNAGRPCEVTANMFRFTKKRAKSNVCSVSEAGDVANTSLLPDLSPALQPSLQSDLELSLQPSSSSLQPSSSSLQPSSSSLQPSSSSLQPSSSLSDVFENTVSRLAKGPGTTVKHRKDICGAARELVQSFKKLTFYMGGRS